MIQERRLPPFFGQVAQWRTLLLPHHGYRQRIHHLIDIASSIIRCAFLFIHSGDFYSASSSPLLLRGALDTARIWPTVSEFHVKAPQALVKDLFKSLRLERDSNPRPFGRISDERRRIYQWATTPRKIFGDDFTRLRIDNGLFQDRPTLCVYTCIPSGDRFIYPQDNFTESRGYSVNGTPADNFITVGLGLISYLTYAVRKATCRE